MLTKKVETAGSMGFPSNNLLRRYLVFDHRFFRCSFFVGVVFFLSTVFASFPQPDGHDVLATVVVNFVSLASLGDPFVSERSQTAVQFVSATLKDEDF